MAKVVPIEQLEDVWPQVRHWIAAAIEYGQGDENEFDVLLALSRCEYLLFWEPGKYASVVQVQHYPQQKVAAILYAGGSDTAAMKREIEAWKPWCRSHGISQIRIWGRTGWERVLGLKRKAVILQGAV